MTELEELFKQWQDLQPLNEAYSKRLKRKFMLEFNYNSNHIEGNTLTYGQTEILLLFGRVVSEANMRDLEEMKAHNVCLNMIETKAKSKETEDHKLTESFIRQLHHTLLREDYEVYRQLPGGPISSYTVHAGKYKTRPNSVLTATGETFEYAPPEETPALMKDLVCWYNDEEEKQELSPLELASIFHYRYIRIHPFEDGNGRIARLLVNYILARHDYPMIVIKSDDKDAYLDALHECDLAVGSLPSDGAHAQKEKLLPFIRYIRSCLIRALKVCIKAANGENIEEDDDFAKELAIIKRNSKKAISASKRSATLDDKIEIYNSLLVPFAQKILDNIKSAAELFDQREIIITILGKKDLLDTKNKDLLVFRKLSELNLHDLNTQEKLIVKNADNYSFVYLLSNVNRNYDIKDIRIDIIENISFEDKFYLFNKKEYFYGNFPLQSDINGRIQEIKQNVLQQIKNAQV
ncbi:Fic family protein [Succinatimonas hippei]|uniref:Fic family protein n=1 Tax=Succinatimonas hippei TaxID=626938 RepID=UPI0026EB6409|nr:Fic family protein [Succinatimonas hippei]